jgi:hypothetical protein
MLSPLLVWRPEASFIYLCPLPFYIIASILFYRRRTLHPISGRFPPLVHAMNIGLFAVGCFEGYTNLSASQPCFVRQFTFMVHLTDHIPRPPIICTYLTKLMYMLTDIYTSRIGDISDQVLGTIVAI